MSKTIVEEKRKMPLIEAIEDFNEKVKGLEIKTREAIQSLASQITVEFGALGPHLTLRGAELTVYRSIPVEAFEAFLYRAEMHKLYSKELIRKLALHLRGLILDLFRSEELTWAGNNVEVKILPSSILTAPLHGFIMTYGDEMLVTELTYAYVSKKIMGSRGIREHETIDPILVYAKIKSGVIIERGFKPVIHDNNFLIADRTVKVDIKTKAMQTLPTLMSHKTLERFVKGEVARDFEKLFTDLKNRNMKFVNLNWDPRLYDFMVCFEIATYFYDLFTTFPRLFIFGVYGSGKTRLLLTATYVSRHGFPVLDPSDAASFRSFEAYGPTWGIDESVLTPKLAKIIAAGYKKGLKVPRIEKIVKERFILSLFESYTPVVLASTEDINELLKQRSIVITMEVADDPIGRDPEAWEFEDIREELYLARLTRAWEVYQTYRTLQLPEFKGRAEELWKPILTIAKLAGDDVYNSVYNLALEDLERRYEELYSKEKTLLEGMFRLLEIKREESENPEEATIIEFTASDLRDILKIILVNEKRELTEKQFERMWSTIRIGKMLSRMKLKKQRRKNARLYVVDVKDLLLLSRRFGYKPAGDRYDTSLLSFTESITKNDINLMEKGDRYDGYDGFLEKSRCVSHHKNDISFHDEKEGNFLEKPVTPVIPVTETMKNDINLQLRVTDRKTASVISVTPVIDEPSKVFWAVEKLKNHGGFISAKRFEQDCKANGIDPDNLVMKLIDRDKIDLKMIDGELHIFLREADWTAYNYMSKKKVEAEKCSARRGD
ncbi:MAG: hypothetical protein NDF55_09145 [archaeon GB-1867-005]|nr:hypothetical protein [Candidatus Culexmicrobium cathedralense]